MSLPFVAQEPETGARETRIASIGIAALALQFLKRI